MCCTVRCTISVFCEHFTLLVQLPLNPQPEGKLRDLFFRFSLNVRVYFFTTLSHAEHQQLLAEPAVLCL